MINEAAYWIALAHLPKWGNFKINSLVKNIYTDQRISIKDFFDLSVKDWENTFNLDKKEIETLLTSKSEIPSDAFLAETLNNNGIELIPIISTMYPHTLKNNMSELKSPTVLYTKGNIKIFLEKSVAIVGSRNANELSLKFTENIAKRASKNFKVIVSGFAKGVDKKALDSAIENKGQSIIVLPQGIMTFENGFRSYYKDIINGNLLVVSSFLPKAPWRVELAMARNPIIYGLANEIYVAESSEKGGTWSGAMDGLRKGRRIFVRKPQQNEKNANEILIQKGAIPVDSEGNEISEFKKAVTVSDISAKDSFKNEFYRIYDLLKTGDFTINEILNNLNLSWTENELKEFLIADKNIEVINKSPLKFKAKNSDNNQISLFES